MRQIISLLATVATAIVFTSSPLSAEIPTLSSDSLQAENLYSKGLASRKAAKYDSAVTYFYTAREAFAEQKHIARFAKVTYSLANTVRDIGNLPEAITVLKEAINLVEQHQGKNNTDYAKLHDRTAAMLIRTNEFQSAQIHLQEALRVRLALFGDNHSITAKSYNTHANYFIAIGEYDSCLTYIRKSLDICRAEFGEEHPRTGIQLFNLGVILSEVGRYREALANMERASKIIEADRGSDSPSMANSYSMIANALHKKSDFAHAIENRDKAFHILRNSTGLNNEVGGDLYLNNAVDHIFLREYDTAVEELRHSLRIFKSLFGNSHGKVALAHLNLGETYFYMDMPDSALVHLNQATHIYRELHGNTYPLLAEPYHQIGKIHLAANRLEEAKTYFELGLELNKPLLDESHPKVAKSHRRLAEVALEQGRSDVAIELTTKAFSQLTSKSEDESKPLADAAYGEQIKLLHTRGKAHSLAAIKASGAAAASSRQSTLDDLLMAVALTDDLRTSFRSQLSQLNTGQEFAQLYSDGVAAALSLMQADKTIDTREEIFYFVEKSKAAVLSQIINESAARTGSSLADSALVHMHQLEAEITSYATQILTEEQKGNQRDENKLGNLYAKRLDLLNAYHDEVAQLEANSPEYYTLKYGSNQLSLGEVQENLGDNTAILEYMYAENVVYLLVITNDQFETLVLENRDDISQTARNVNRSLQRPFEHNQFAGYSHDLFEMTISPALPLLTGIEQLIIIPDAALSYIPFEALLIDRATDNSAFSDFPYLIRGYEISYHYSANLLFSQRRTKSAATVKEFGGFAPVFADGSGYVHTINTTVWEDIVDVWDRVTRDGRNFAPLQHSEAEVNQILDAFTQSEKKSSGFFFDEASEETFKRTAGDYKFLHLATHSFVHPEQPDLSGIAFALPQGTDALNDGILHAGEIFNLQLNADLVVLSSCESGRGQYIRGEGMMALTRGFIHAGAPHIVVSLWSVVDEFTKDMMVTFYDSLLAGEDYATALRTAKLEMISSRDGANPKYWSSFILIGE